MRKRGATAATLAGSAAPMDPQAVVPSELLVALTERPALVRAPVRNVVRNPLSGVLTVGPAMVLTQAAAAVQAAARVLPQFVYAHLILTFLI